MKRRGVFGRIGAVMIVAVSVVVSGEVPAALPDFDFTSAAVATQWVLLHDVTGRTVSTDGMSVRITGEDPYLSGPARDYPAGRELWLNLRLKSERGGACQVFYYRSQTGPTEPESVRFPVPAGAWYTARVPVPALGASYQLRIDPPGDGGTCTLGRLWFDERLRFEAPAWPVPVPPIVAAGDPSVSSGGLTVTHRPDRFGAFVVTVGGVPVAVGQTQPVVGYVVDGRARWWSLNETATAAVRAEGDVVVVSVAAVDPDGAHWTFGQTFRRGPGPGLGVVAVETRARVDRDRAVVYWAPLTLLARDGAGSTRKQQALLAGVEYLDDEPSSSEADLQGAQARRQVTDTARLTFPLAAVVAAGRYVALTWEMRREVAVVFDTPDRLFRSGGHLLGLVVPGSDGLNREEGSLVPYDPLVLAAGEDLVVKAEILGGLGTDAVPVIQQYVGLHPLPAMPATGGTAVDYFRLAARGWLDSRIREGDLFRHATPGAFTAGPAVDAAFGMDWLAGRVEDDALAGRLREASAAALARVAPAARYGAGIGHVRFPVAPLVYGALVENLATATQEGRGLLGRFATDGTVRYTPVPGGIDYGRTHWTNEANGLTAEVVAGVLEAAAWSGDRSLGEAGLRHLRGLSKFRGGVPRGAQTWEVPLHTPDILAAAHLVRAYVAGYSLSGDPAFLDAAQYWAWTGLPFVYLRSPVAGPIGRYATTPVLGATQWVAPNWIGLPVQWCGLVYAAALYRLADLVPGGPWGTVADGITAAGVQMTYPASDTRYLGLLPDSFSLKGQQRNAANINPATVFACAPRFFGAGRVYDTRPFPHHGAWVQAAGAIEVRREDATGFAFRVEGWSRQPHRILVHGMYDDVSVSIDGRATPLAPPHSHVVLAGRLILEVTGSVVVEIRHPARSALHIETVPGQGAASLTWPAAAGEVIVESAVELGTAGAWQPLATASSEGGPGGASVVPVEGPSRFFRLRRAASPGL